MELDLRQESANQGSEDVALGVILRGRNGGYERNNGANGPAERKERESAALICFIRHLCNGAVVPCQQSLFFGLHSDSHLLMTLKKVQ